MSDAIETRYIALPLRDHTILGVCEAIGEDFGFNPTWIRVPLAASVLYSLPYALAAYALLGIVVLLSRLLFPHPKAVTTVATPSITQPSYEHDGHDDLPLAA